MEHNLDLPPQTELVRYYPIDPVLPEFDYYSPMTTYMGLPESHVVDRNVNPEVGVFF